MTGMVKVKYSKNSWTISGQIVISFRCDTCWSGSGLVSLIHADINYAVFHGNTAGLHLHHRPTRQNYLLNILGMLVWTSWNKNVSHRVLHILWAEARSYIWATFTMSPEERLWSWTMKWIRLDEAAEETQKRWYDRTINMSLNIILPDHIFNEVKTWSETAFLINFNVLLAVPFIQFAPAFYAINVNEAW